MIAASPLPSQPSAQGPFPAAGGSASLVAQPALEVDAIAKRFGRVLALSSVSFTALPGEVTALLGPNGAGKSTTIACATGLLSPDAGRVRVFGTDPTRATADQRSRVGVMLQDGGLTSGATPAQLLRYAAAMTTSPRSPHELADILGITDFERTIVRRLSGGQKQRLALALALLSAPDLLFLDEPTAGMDAAVRRRTRELIRAEVDRGAAVVLTTHAIDDVRALADRVVVIAQGRVIADGSPDQVVDQLEGSGPSRSTLDLSGGTPQARARFIAEISARAQAAGLRLSDVTGSSQLEDILVELTRDQEDAR